MQTTRWQLAAMALCLASHSMADDVQVQAASEPRITLPSTANNQDNSHTTDTDTSWWQTVKDNVRQTWQSEQYELYVPLRTWHNRAVYSREKIKSFNESPWGLGFGKYRDTEHNTTHSLGFMVFADSHNDPEPFLAYSWQKNWSVSQNQKVSLGAFAGITARSDFDYIPIPVAWPYVAYSYKKLSIQGMYFPGSKGNGNIAFFWAKYRF